MSWTAALVGTMLTVPADEKQPLYLAACELMGVLSGLFLPLPLEFLRDVATPQDCLFNAITLVSFISFLTSCLGCLLAALNSVFQGRRGSVAFYEHISTMLSTSFVMFIAGFWSLVAVVVRTSVVMCDGKAVGRIPGIVFIALFQWSMLGWTKLYENELPLELFHLPFVFKGQMMLHCP